MKKIIIFISALFFSSNINSQVYVNEDSQMGIGREPMSDYNLTIQRSNTNGLYLWNAGNHDIHVYSMIPNNPSYSTKYGVHIQSLLKPNVTSYGISVWPSNSSDQTYIGIKSLGGNSSSLSFALAGGLGSNNITNGAGVYGCSGSGMSINTNHQGVYAGYFKGDVRVTGTLYANVLTPSAASSSPDSQNDASTTIQVVSRDVDEEGASVSDKLRQVQLLRIQHIEPFSASADEKFAGISSKPIEIEAIELALQAGEELTAEQLETLETYEDASATNDDVPQTHMSSVRYGLAADQLQNVYPELVYEDQNGNVSINYIEMIPLLVQSINELQERVEALEEENSTLKNTYSHSPSRKNGRITNNKITDDGTDIISLEQNVPNPFTDKTAIAVNVPKSVRSAALFIYDMSGKQVDKIQITDRGKSSISVSGTNLQDGMYLYSLITDGKVIDTRKMILTK